MSPLAMLCVPCVLSFLAGARKFSKLSYSHIDAVGRLLGFQLPEKSSSQRWKAKFYSFIFIHIFFYIADIADTDINIFIRVLLFKCVFDYKCASLL